MRSKIIYVVLAGLVVLVCLAGFINQLVAPNEQPLPAVVNTASAAVAVKRPAGLSEDVFLAYQALNTLVTTNSRTITSLTPGEFPTQYFEMQMLFDRKAGKLKINRPEEEVLVNDGKLTFTSTEIPERYLNVSLPAGMSLVSILQNVPHFAQPKPFDLSLLLGDQFIPGDVEELAANANGQRGLRFTSEGSTFNCLINPVTNLIDEVNQQTIAMIHDKAIPLLIKYQFKTVAINQPILPGVFSIDTSKGKPVATMQELVGTGPVNKLVGTVPAAFTLKDINGRSVSLEALMKKYPVLVIDFWASWCGPCRISLPRLEKLSAKFQKENQPVGFYTVNQGESLAKAREAMSSLKLTLPTLMDPNMTLADQFKMTGLPNMLIIVDGKIHMIRAGAYMNEKDDDVEAILRQIIASRSAAATAAATPAP